MTNSEKTDAPWAGGIAFGFGGALVASLLSPFQRIVVLQQLGQHRSYIIPQLTRYIYARDGLKGFWRGNLTTLIIYLPFKVIELVTCALCASVMSNWAEKRQRRRGATDDERVKDDRIDLVAQCIALGVAGAAVYPGEVVRLRLMSGEKQFNGIAHTCKLVYRETNSLRNFYRGLPAYLAMKVSTYFLTICIYLGALQYGATSGTLNRFSGTEMDMLQFFFLWHHSRHRANDCVDSLHHPA